MDDLAGRIGTIPILTVFLDGRRIPLERSCGAKTARELAAVCLYLGVVAEAEAYVTVRIAKPGMSAGDVTARLGIEPTDSHDIGDPRPRGTPHRHAMWSLSTKSQDRGPLQEHLARCWMCSSRSGTSCRRWPLTDSTWTGSALCLLRGTEALFSKLICSSAWPRFLSNSTSTSMVRRLRGSGSAAGRMLRSVTTMTVGMRAVVPNSGCLLLRLRMITGH